jgi:isocitrate/isopropylmalate dehydrogenase
LANPLALLMSAVMMLNYLSDQMNDPESSRIGRQIKAAYNAALAEGCKTRDLGGELGTREFAEQVVERLQ